MSRSKSKKDKKISTKHYPIFSLFLLSTVYILNIFIVVYYIVHCAIENKANKYSKKTLN